MSPLWRSHDKRNEDPGPGKARDGVGGGHRRQSPEAINSARRVAASGNAVSPPR